MDNHNYHYERLLRQMTSEGVDVTLCSDFAGGAIMHQIASTIPTPSSGYRDERGLPLRFYI